MPITSSAKKALRASKRKHAFNLARKTAMKKATKVAISAVKEPANVSIEKLSLAYKAIDKAMKRGVIKKNTASRKKSRLAKKVNKLKTAVK